MNRENHQLYLYVGELEGIYKDTIQAHMVDYTKKAHREFIVEGYLESNLLFELNSEGTHDDLFPVNTLFKRFTGYTGVKVNYSLFR